MGTTCKEDSVDLFVRVLIDGRLKVKCMRPSYGGSSIRLLSAANSCYAGCCARRSSKDCFRRVGELGRRHLTWYAKQVTRRFEVCQTRTVGV